MAESSNSGALTEMSEISMPSSGTAHFGKGADSNGSSLDLICNALPAMGAAASASDIDDTDLLAALATSSQPQPPPVVGTTSLPQAEPPGEPVGPREGGSFPTTAPNPNVVGGDVTPQTGNPVGGETPRVLTGPPDSSGGSATDPPSRFVPSSAASVYDNAVSAMNKNLEKAATSSSSSKWLSGSLPRRGTSTSRT